MNIDNYVDYILAQAEGTKAHTGQEGAPTAAYGLTAAATKNNPQRPGESARDYAARVVSEKYAAEAEKAVGTKAWNAMPEGMKVVAVDVNYNSGLKNNPSFVNALKSGNYEQALKNTLDIVGVTQNGNKYTSTGLANRRAAIYNVGAQSINASKISNVDVNKLGNTKTQLTYLDESGKPIQQLSINRPLAPDSKPGLKTPMNYNYPLGDQSASLNTISPADINARSEARMARQEGVVAPEPTFFESLQNSLLSGWDTLSNYFNQPEQQVNQEAAQQQQQAVQQQNQATQDLNAKIAAIFGTAASQNAAPTSSNAALGNFINKGMLGPSTGTALGNVQALQQAQQAKTGLFNLEQAQIARENQARAAAAAKAAQEAAAAQAAAEAAKVAQARAGTTPVTGRSGGTAYSGSFGGGWGDAGTGVGVGGGSVGAGGGNAAGGFSYGGW